MILPSAPPAAASADTITTVAGGPGRGPAQEVSMEPVAVTVNGSLLYVADRTYGVVRVVDLNAGTTNVLTGSDTALLPYSGPVPVPGVADPCALAFDPAGVLHVADAATRRIYRVASDGALTAVMGGATIGTGAHQTSLQRPCGLTFDAAGNLYIADGATDVVSRLDVDGEVTRIAGGNATLDWHGGDGGPAFDAVLDDPTDVAVDQTGSIFIAEFGRIRRIGPDGIITTYAGDRRGDPESGDGGPAIDASIAPRRMALTNDGGMYVVEGNRLRHIDAGGILTTVAGSSTFGGTGDGGPAQDALLYAPADVTVGDGIGIVIADTGTGRIRVIAPDGTIRTVAGLPRHPSRYGTSGYPERTRYGGDGGLAIDAQLHDPGSLALTPTDNLLVADVGNARVRELTRGGLLQTRAGGGCCWPFSDGPTSVPEIRSVGDLAAGPAGEVYVRDGNRIKQVASDGTVTIVAGTGYSGAGGDAVNAQEASLSSASSVAVAGDGGVYIGQQDHVGRVAADGTLTRFAGGGDGGLGDGGPARNATLTASYRRDVAVDRAGNVFIDDGDRIRKVNAAGVISTVAGTGAWGFSGDGGPALSAQISVGVLTVAGDGSIFFSNPTEAGVVIRRVLPTGVIHTIAGSGEPGFGGDGGAPTDARFTDVTGIAATAEGVVYVSDRAAHRVRSFSFTPAPPPSPPDPVTNLVLRAGMRNAVLSWADVSDDARAGVVVRRTLGSVPAATPTSGQAVYSGSAAGVTARGLTYGATFTFTVFAVNADGLYSRPAARTAWSTAVTAVPSRSRVKPGQWVSIRGRLLSAQGSGRPLPRRAVRVDVRRRGTTVWKPLKTTTTSSTGSFVVAHQPRWSSQYRAVFVGGGAHLGSRSSVASIIRG